MEYCPRTTVRGKHRARIKAAFTATIAPQMKGPAGVLQKPKWHTGRIYGIIINSTILLVLEPIIITIGIHILSSIVALFY